MRIPQSEIDRVLDATNIEDVIGEYVQLRREGARYKCCCPVHSEKTPSFVVTPRMNIYKCFGCGIAGNAISFLTKVVGMDYIDAVKHLAKKANITLRTEEKEYTAREQEEQRELDSAKIVNEAAAKFFQEQLFASNPRAEFARKYAFDRWGENHVKESGIGFAPGRGTFRAWAREKGFSEALLLRIGLLKQNQEGKIYDTFYDRIMMPIQSRSNQVLGFTGRVLDDSKPKYINSKESGLFHKSEIIFGLNVATREAAKEGLFYLVEGSPDVYRLQIIGASNAVASLGTAWSASQFEVLRKYNATICFIPDIDKPGAREEYGPGILSVMKNGKTAIKAGLRVIVKEMDPGDNDKVDVDSHIHSRDALEAIPTEDFVIWYASKCLSNKETESARSEVMKDVCQLLAQVHDKDYVKILIKKLAKVIGVTAGLIQNAVNTAVKGNAEKKLIEEEKLLDRELYSKYGFYERHNCYYSMNGDGIEQRWSNFTLKPLFHIKDQLNPKRLYMIKNVTGVKELIELKQEDLVSLQRFKLRTEGMGNYIWEAKDQELTKLKSFLYEKTESAIEITQLGLQRDGFFAFGNGAVHEGQWIPCDDLGIARIAGVGNFYLPASSRIYRDDLKLFQFERKFIHTNMSDISFRAYTDKMIEVFGDNAKVGICFFPGHIV